MPRPGRIKDLRSDVGLSEAAGIRCANSLGTSNTADSSAQQPNPNRLNQVPKRNPDGTSEINTLGREPYPIPGGIP